jgi:hypothetical protein
MKNNAILTWLGASVLALGLLSYSTASIALGTAEERAACTPDVFRLCGSEIPNVTQIIACLKAKKAQLSPGCKTAFNPPPTTTASAKTRSLASLASYWCNFHGVSLDPGQQNWIQWCGPAARK